MKDIFKKTLVITPHSDDETIGSGGLLHKLGRLYDSEILVVVVARSNSLNYSINRVVTLGERTSEMVSALNVLGKNIKYEMLIEPDGFEYLDGELDTVPKNVYITELDKVIKRFRPTAVLIPYASHHQDHKLVNEVSIAALRPSVDTDYIKLKAMYEYPYYDSWNHNKLDISKFYIELDTSDIKAKKSALGFYKSQLERNEFDPLDQSAIMDLAKVRGREISKPYAEVLYPLSLIF